MTRTPLDTVESLSSQVRTWDPAVVAIGKIVIGCGLIGLVLWMSPYVLTDLLMTFGLPLLIIVALLASTGIIGGGVLELANSKSLGAKVQEYVREARDTAEDVRRQWQ